MKFLLLILSIIVYNASASDRCKWNGVYHEESKECVCVAGFYGKDCSMCAPYPYGKDDKTFLCCSVPSYAEPKSLEQKGNVFLIIVDNITASAYLRENGGMCNLPGLDGYDCACRKSGKNVAQSNSYGEVLNSSDSYSWIKQQQEHHTEVISDMYKSLVRAVDSNASPSCTSGINSTTGTIVFIVLMTVGTATIVMLAIWVVWWSIRGQPARPQPKIEPSQTNTGYRYTTRQIGLFTVEN